MGSQQSELFGQFVILWPLSAGLYRGVFRCITGNEKKLVKKDNPPIRGGGQKKTACQNLVRVGPFHGSKGTKTPSDRLTFCAHDLGSYHAAPTTDDDEEENELYSKEHGSEAHEQHRGDDALF